MQLLKTLRTISLISVFVLVSFGCATSKNVSDADFRITAESTEEGILVSFINLPQDTTHLWIQFDSWGDTEKAERQRSIVSSFAGLTDASFDGWVNSTQNLDKVKQTGKIIFPFVEAGTKYHIMVMAQNENEHRAMRNVGYESALTAYAEVLAENGIYFNRDDVKLELDNTNSTVTLISEPAFSSELSFCEKKYSFGTIVALDDEDGRSISVGDHHSPAGLSAEGLTWTFEPYFTNILKTDDVAIDWLGVGTTHSAYAFAYVNITYDEINWSIEIAKSSEFDIHL